MIETAELTAGSELDVLVAEKVMGLIACDQWQPMNLGSGGGPVMMGHSEKDSPHPGVNCYPAVPGSKHPYNGPQRYSMEIRAAWAVVEKLRPHYDFRLEVDTDKYWAMFARVLKRTEDGAVAGPRCEAEAETAPLAICLAALMAISKR